MIAKLFSHERFQATQWGAYRFVDRLGLAGKLALLGSTLVVGVFLLNYLPMRQQMRALNAELANKKIPASQAHKSVDPQATLHAYLAQFPKLTQKNSKLNDWMQIAEQHDLQPDSVVYKAAHAEKMALLQPTVVDFSLYAPYGDVQNFLNQVLTQMPFVAVERLSLNKEDETEEAIVANIQLKFYFATPGQVTNE